jgi:hypothetical protein
MKNRRGASAQPAIGERNSACHQGFGRGLPLEWYPRRAAVLGGRHGAPRKLEGLVIVSRAALLVWAARRVVFRGQRGSTNVGVGGGVRVVKKAHRVRCSFPQFPFQDGTQPS